MFSLGNPTAQLFWLIALVGLLLTIAITLSYHLPTNFGFIEQKYSTAKATSKLKTWVLLHWLRVAIAIISAASGILGFQQSF